MNATASPLATSQKSSVYLAIAGDVTGSITRLNSDSVLSPGLRLFGTRKRLAPSSLTSLHPHPFFSFSVFLLHIFIHESLAENLGHINLGKATADIRPALSIPSSVSRIKNKKNIFGSISSFFSFFLLFFPLLPVSVSFGLSIIFLLLDLFLLLLLDLFPQCFPQCSAETSET